jgi:hypothetical protein
VTLKEHNFLKEICLSALSLDKNVKFVGAVDSDGKLLAGEFNKYKFFGNNDTLTVKSSLFYVHYLIPALKHQQVTNEPSNTSIQNKNVFLFDLADLGNAVYLAVTPLTEKKDRYLCVYLELYSTSEIIAHEEIISKISDIL